MAVAKGIGSGFPLGACLATNKSCISMIKGSHGSTYGGNPLAMKIGNAVLDKIMNKKFLKNVEKISKYFFMELNKNPLTPHLQIYRWHISSLLSITHRIIGVINILSVTLSETFSSNKA